MEHSHKRRRITNSTTTDENSTTQTKQMNKITWPEKEEEPDEHAFLKWKTLSQVLNSATDANWGRQRKKGSGRGMVCL
jgi:hypothetical protein